MKTPFERPAWVLIEVSETRLKVIFLLSAGRCPSGFWMPGVGEKGSFRTSLHGVRNVAGVTEWGGWEVGGCRRGEENTGF